MSTAIIVSGTLRELVNASSSWSIPGDYFLIINKDTHTHGNPEPTGNSLDILQENLQTCHVKFNTVTVLHDSQLPEILKWNATVSMINKWRLSYYTMLSYSAQRNYDRVFLLRPDLYLFKKRPIHSLLNLPLEENTIYTTAEIIFQEFPVYGAREIMNDVLLMTTPNTFGNFVNELSAYYLERYEDTINNGYEVHTMMARFCREKNYIVKNTLSAYFDFVVLRPNSRNLFDCGVLRPEHSFRDLRTKEQEWWQEKYGTK